MIQQIYSCPPIKHKPADLRLPVRAYLCFKKNKLSNL